MARVTVEDCIDKVENCFDLVLLAGHRARMIASGTQIAVDRDNDKNPVVALREIAEQAISPEDLKEELVHSLQKYVEVDEPEPETVPLIGAPGTGVDADDTERHDGPDVRGRAAQGPGRPHASGKSARARRWRRRGIDRASRAAFTVLPSHILLTTTGFAGGQASISLCGSARIVAPA